MNFTSLSNLLFPWSKLLVSYASLIIIWELKSGALVFKVLVYNSPICHSTKMVDQSTASHGHRPKLSQIRRRIEPSCHFCSSFKMEYHYHYHYKSNFTRRKILNMLPGARHFIKLTMNVPSNLGQLMLILPKKCFGESPKVRCVKKSINHWNHPDHHCYWRNQHQHWPNIHHLYVHTFPPFITLELLYFSCVKVLKMKLN